MIILRQWIGLDVFMKLLKEGAVSFEKEYLDLVALEYSLRLLIVALIEKWFKHICEESVK